MILAEWNSYSWQLILTVNLANDSDEEMRGWSDEN